MGKFKRNKRKTKLLCDIETCNNIINVYMHPKDIRKHKRQQVKLPKNNKIKSFDDSIFSFEINQSVSSISHLFNPINS